MPERVDCIVVGAGVVGLAIARRLARNGREVVIVEAANRFGTESSARNSEVVHAGIYYPPASLKARLCRNGCDRLYAYLTRHGVEHIICGKLIVATSEIELPALHALEARALRNGVKDIRLLNAAATLAIEPALRCVAALHSPSTGIFDSHGFMLSLLGEAEAAGAVLALASPVIDGALSGDGIQLTIGGAQPMDVVASIVVNAAGLGAQTVAGAIDGFPMKHVPPLHYAKGNYFTLAQRPPFTSLVYPLPDLAGLGVHYQPVDDVPFVIRRDRC